MPNKFDPYREALVVETKTIWLDACEKVKSAERARFEEALHAAPDQCAELQYIRTHTGFCRQISVTPDDLERVRS
ncbi:MAG: hypothetical protein ACC628_16355 [Pirellulaceae bacterium]